MGIGRCQVANGYKPIEKKEVIECQRGVVDLRGEKKRVKN
jgi:hypothetical protein